MLIEEDGVIKKAPKTAVGGAGGGEIDGIIYSSTVPEYANGASSFTVEQFDFAAIKNKILAGEDVNVMLHYTYSYGDNYELWSKSVGAGYNHTNDRIVIAWSVLNCGYVADTSPRQYKVSICIDSNGAVYGASRA